MLGAIVNTLTVLAGGLIGLLLKKGISERFSDIIMKGIALCVLFIGISGSLTGSNVIISIVCVVIGGILGEALKLEAGITKLGDKLQEKFSKGNEKSSVSKGFVTASLVFCVGAMTIVGALQSGIDGNHSTQFTKAILDGIGAIVFASSMGAGVLLAAGTVFVIQGGITLMAQWVAPLLTDAIISQMTNIGSILIMGLALNMLGLTKLKVMNYVPAIILPIGLIPLIEWVQTLF